MSWVVADKYEKKNKPLIHLDLKKEQPLVAGAQCGILGYKGPDDDGFYLKWEWDGEVLSVLSYPNGFYPAYYCCNESEFILCDNLVQICNLIDQPLVFDDIAFAAFLCTGMYFKDATPFKDIFAMPEGGRVAFSAFGLVRSTREMSELGMRGGGVTEFAKDYSRLFSDAMSADLPTVSCLPLSGGRDSRHILLELLNLNANFSAVTAFKNNSKFINNDVEIASKLCNELGVENHKVVFSRFTEIEAECIKNLASSFSFLEGGWKCALMHHCKSEDVAIYDGIGGDFLSRGKFVDGSVSLAFKNGEFAPLLKIIDKRNDANIGALSEVVGFMYENDKVTEYIKDHMSDYLGEVSPISEFFLWNRARRQIASMSTGIYGKGRIVTPYLNLNLFQFLRAVPENVTGTKILHDRAIELCNISCDIPFAIGEKNVASRSAIFYDSSLFIKWLSGSDLGRSFIRVRSAELLKSWMLPSAWRLKSIEREKIISALQLASIKQRSK